MGNQHTLELQNSTAKLLVVQHDLSGFFETGMPHFLGPVASASGYRTPYVYDARGNECGPDLSCFPLRKRLNHKSYVFICTVCGSQQATSHLERAVTLLNIPFKQSQDRNTPQMARGYVERRGYYAKSDRYRAGSNAWSRLNSVNSGRGIGNAWFVGGA